MTDPAEITARPGPEPDAMFEIPFSRIEEMRVERERLSARVAVLEAQKQAALELHQPFEWSFGFGPVKSCRHCASLGADEALSAWPCATFRALGGEETT